MRTIIVYSITMLVFCCQTVFEVGSAPRKISSTPNQDVFSQQRKRIYRSGNANWKECSWTKLSVYKHYGLITECVFLKKRQNSVLHVYWNGELSVNLCSHCCKRWYFTFNGAECWSPRPIDGLVYVNHGKLAWFHRVRHIEGHCENIHKGNVRVGINVGDCAPRYGNPANAYTGWHSTSRLFVEEVPRPQS